jgi:hypothetical protein
MKAIVIILALLFLVGCDNSQNKSSSANLRTPDQQKAGEFVDSITGVKQAYDSRIAQVTAETTDTSLNTIVPPADVQSVANRFYGALGRGDGQAASSLVVPAKRDGGPLSSPALSHFYTTLGSKFVVDNVQSTGPNQATVHYRYFNQARKACVAYSVVTIGERNNIPLIAKIVAPTGC